MPEGGLVHHIRDSNNIFKMEKTPFGAAALTKQLGSKNKSMTTLSVILGMKIYVLI